LLHGAIGVVGRITLNPRTGLSGALTVDAFHLTETRINLQRETVRIQHTAALIDAGHTDAIGTHIVDRARVAIIAGRNIYRIHTITGSIAAVICTWIAIIADLQRALALSRCARVAESTRVRIIAGCAIWNGRCKALSRLRITATRGAGTGGSRA